MPSARCSGRARGFIAPPRASAPLLLVVGALGCNAPATIEVQPQPVLLKRQGEKLKLDVRVKDKKGLLLPDARPTFTALTPEVLTVDTDGTVTALRSGEGAVLVAVGDVSATPKIGVRIAKRIEIEPSNPVFNLGVGTQLKAIIYDDRGDPMITAQPLRWSVSDPKVLALDGEGTIKTLEEGRATITAYLEDLRATTVVTVKHESYDEKEGSWE